MLIAMAVHDTPENGRSWMTKATLGSLVEQVNWSQNRLIIVDNCSCEKTQDLYKDFNRRFPLFPFVLIRNGLNVGTARAINQAWKFRNPGEHAVKIDNDVVVHKRNWPHLMEEVFARDSEIGICGLKRNDLGESPWGEGNMKSTLRMLPHEKGQRWIVVEEVEHVMGTCQAYSSDLLGAIGYLVQPGIYGYDDSLSSLRAKIAGFKRAFLLGIEITHVDPGGAPYNIWKREEAGRDLAAFNAMAMVYEAGGDVYHGGP